MAGPVTVERRGHVQIARAQADWTVEEGWKRQEELYKPVFASADAREGAAAFAEKRAPVWRGI
jgi:enoyl-CoA hydratase